MAQAVPGPWLLAKARSMGMASGYAHGQGHGYRYGPDCGQDQRQALTKASSKRHPIAMAIGMQYTMEVAGIS